MGASVHACGGWASYVGGGEVTSPLRRKQTRIFGGKIKGPRARHIDSGCPIAGSLACSGVRGLRPQVSYLYVVRIIFVLAPSVSSRPSPPAGAKTLRHSGFPGDHSTQY